VFGIPGEHADVATLVAGLLLAQAVHKGAKRLLRVPDLPSAGDAALGASAVRQVVLGVAGPSSDETPLVGTLIAIAVVGKLARPVIDRAVHGMEASAHRMRAAFNRRYGYLIVHARRVVPREGDRSRAA
jgi:hypothetical protein